MAIKDINLDSYTISMMMGGQGVNVEAVATPVCPMTDPYGGSLFDNRSVVGVEFEIEQFPNSWCKKPPTIPRSYIKRDDSLRNNGREIITVPMQFQDFRRYLYSLYNEWLPDQVEYTKRCSIHVHCNALHFSLRQVHSVILTYMLVERILFNFAKENRAKNIFCVPLYQTDVVDGLFEWVRNGCQNENIPYEKYAALNLRKLSGYTDAHPTGTVEFRIFPGTWDETRLLTWVGALLRLMEFAYGNKYDDLLKIFTELNSNSAYVQVVSSIFGEFTAPLIEGVDLQEMIEDAVVDIKLSNFTNETYQMIQKKPRPDLMSRYVRALHNYYGPFEIK